MLTEKQGKLIEIREVEILDILNGCQQRKFMEIPAMILKQNFLVRDNAENTLQSMNRWIGKINELLNEEAYYFISLGIEPPYVSRLENIY